MENATLPRQSNGSYIAPANTAAVSGQSISSVAFNTLETDIGTEITNSMDRLGRSAMQAAMPMGANKITGMADPTISTDAATKNYVDTLTAAFFSTGDVKATFKIVADTGFLMMDDGTVGNTGSGANHADPSYLALYTLLWTNISSPTANAWCAVTGGLGGSAAADWAGLKPLALPKALGRTLVGSGSGAGLSFRPLGMSIGTENTTLSSVHIPTITSTNPSQTITVTAPNSNAFVTGSGVGNFLNSTGASPGINNLFVNATTASGANSISTTYTNGSPSSFNIIQPGIWLNFMIKI